MKRVFLRACLFLLASIFLFENAGFITHELALAVGLAFLAALVISYLPLKTEGASASGVALGVVLMVVAVAAMPGEFLRPGALALFLLGTSLLVRGFKGEAPELPLFSVTAAGYGIYMFLYRSDVHVWRWVKSISFEFSKLVAALTTALPGTKALLGPAFIGAGVIVTFALLFIVGSFFLNGNRLRKAGKALGAMVLITAIYAVAFTYAPSAFNFQFKVGPIPSEAEQSQVRQAKERFYGKHMEKMEQRLDSEKKTRVIFSADSFLVDHCALWAPFALGLLFLIPTYYFFKGAELREIPLKASTLFSAGGVALLLLMALGETSQLRVGSQKNLRKAVSQKRVGFYNHGFANWMRPSFKNFGSRSSGMFGNLPDFVESMGFRQPLPGANANGQGRAAPPAAREEALRRLKIWKGKAERVTRDQNAYIDAGVLLTEITRESLEDIDILMFLNINGLLNSEDPRRLPYHSPMQRSRKALWARYKEVSGLINAIRREENSDLEKLKTLHERLVAKVDEVPEPGVPRPRPEVPHEKLKEQLVELENQLSVAEAEINVPMAELEQRQAGLVKEQVDLQRRQEELIPEMHKLAGIKSKLQAKQKEKAATEKQLAAWRRDPGEDERKLEALAEEAPLLEKEANELEKKLASLQTTLDAWEQLRTQQADLITGMQDLVNEERKLTLSRTQLRNQQETLVRRMKEQAGRDKDQRLLEAKLTRGENQLKKLAELVKPQEWSRRSDPRKKLDALEAGLIGLQEQWHKAALELIWEFVEDGGALLVIGDHTFYKKMEDLPVGAKTELWLNKVLEPFDIKFVNDSAKYFIGGWLQSMENPLHSLTFGLRDDQNEVGMVVGASLAVTGAARPVIVGKYGYLDAGDMREGTRGYLGNMDYDMGEPLGQIVIAAEQDYGKGKVIVFGDTSAFANGIITNTGGFCNRVFTWLAAESGEARSLKEKEEAGKGTSDGGGSGVSSAWPTVRSWLKTFAAIILVVAAVACFRLSGGYAGVVAGALVIGFVVAAHSTNVAVPLGPGQNKELRLAYVDNYHMPKISKEGWRDDGLMGLHLNLMRNGFYTQNLKRFDLETLEGATLVVSAAPSAPFTRKDVKTVRRYLEGGGTMILTTSHEDLAATKRLLDAFDLKIPYTPLGRFKIPVESAGRKFVPFWRVWPIEYTGDNAGRDPADTIARHYGQLPVKADREKKPFKVIIPYEPNTGGVFDLGVTRRVGKGQLIIIGDSGFWMNKNLEIEKMNEVSGAAKKNYTDSIYFMQWMLETHVQ